MSEVMLPPWIIPEDEPQEPMDDGSSVFRSAFAPGIAQRQSYGGLRLKLSRRHTVRLEEKAHLLSAIRSTRGSYNSLRTKVHFVLRGSFPSSELITNGTFSSGSTGWSAGSAYSLSASERMLYARRTSNSGTASVNVTATSGISLTQYAPYVLRFMVKSGRGSAFTPNVFAGLSSSTSEYGFPSQAAQSIDKLNVHAFVPYSAATTFVGLSEFSATGIEVGDFLVIPYVSLARCALVDNAANMLQASEDFGDAAWGRTNATVGINATSPFLSPNGIASADALIDDATNGLHQFYQDVTVSSSEFDISYGVAIAAGARSWAYLQVVNTSTSLTTTAYFNLSTGAVGTTVTQTGFSNLRTFVEDLGTYKRFTIVCRKTAANTQLRFVVGAANGDNVASYVGAGTNAIYAWRATAALSSVPTRLASNTAAVPSGTAQSGGTLFVKGLPSSTSGLLLPEDIVEINGEIKTCTSALNSDSAGLGCLRFEPPIVRAPADNDPVVITDPMGKFLVSNIKIDNEFGTQARVSYELEHIYE